MEAADCENMREQLAKLNNNVEKLIQLMKDERNLSTVNQKILASQELRLHNLEQALCPKMHKRYFPIATEEELTQLERLYTEDASIKAEISYQLKMIADNNNDIWLEKVFAKRFLVDRFTTSKSHSEKFGKLYLYSMVFIQEIFDHLGHDKAMAACGKEFGRVKDRNRSSRKSKNTPPALPPEPVPGPSTQPIFSESQAEL